MATGKKQKAKAEAQEEKKVQSHREFAATNTKFKDCCVKADVKPTMRQASKYRRGYGKAAQV